MKMASVIAGAIALNFVELARFAIHICDTLSFRP